VRDGEDRFGDLGPAGEDDGPGEDQRSAAEKLEERDRTHPEPVEGRPEVPRPGNRYAWLVGIVMLMGLAVLLFTTTLPNQGEGVLGLDAGEPLPVFAAPLATGPLEGDANVCQRRPCPKGAGTRPACELRSRAVLNLCTLRQRPLILTFVFDRAADCFPQVDRVERVRPDFPQINFATVYFSRKERDEVRALVRRRRWRQPVGVDRDGQIVNRYGIGVCPTTLFAYRGGRTMGTNLGNLTEPQLRRTARRLLRRQAARDRRAR
jgi:hypothetical protein